MRTGQRQAWKNTKTTFLDAHSTWQMALCKNSRQAANKCVALLGAGGCRLCSRPAEVHGPLLLLGLENRRLPQGLARLVGCSLDTKKVNKGANLRTCRGSWPEQQMAADTRMRF